MVNPVVQVTDEDTGEIVYTLRISDREFRPMVFKHGRYTIQLGELGTQRVRVLQDFASLDPQEAKTIAVSP